ncbi:hypothetical protein A1Q2_00938 [Trichosporon asahii var. asahii CBS 8904]|uniref:CsbD-like domain-containing protein n=2 Tax=Trichosporon asahii var. asahii TaxID=189963 RepID=K1W756_TRIAC|nr:hypothetical protein A1Q1_05879 [Trichosporon asahii var. asahii CBS 2479]EJT45730.1 hypothetical protein A1Q1_05879 [Trichosporon asahii var. asahii CBS 2479]EKD04708.1 hypothetical protein A1Q2_00938 [Trichosporon asahii var. asahii CBS 8904]
MSEQNKQEPSQISGQLKGMAEQAIGSVLPGATGDAWIESGQKLQQEGQVEVEEAKLEAKKDATVDSAKGKAKSAFGYVTGNQEMQNEGNMQAEGAQWKYKQANSDGIASVPVPSAEGVKGKLESVAGMVTGDQSKQMEGNARAEKAAWKDGV